jgi:hypothetical protein
MIATALPARQSCKVVYGLVNEPGYAWVGTSIFDDATLMDMDAPCSIPAGSMVRVEYFLATNTGFATLQESTIFRGEQ